MDADEQLLDAAEEAHRWGVEGSAVALSPPLLLPASMRESSEIPIRPSLS